MLRHLVLVLFVLLAPATTLAQTGKSFALVADPELAESGLLDFVLPRFSLKTGIQPQLVDAGGAPDAWLDRQADAGARPVIIGPGGQYFLRLAEPPGPNAAFAQRFADWLTSETGRRTIAQFRAPDGSQPFIAPEPEAQQAEIISFDGDAARGEQVARRACARCHAIGSRDSMNSLGSTPSFGVLRALPDWQERFVTFYLRPPHPALTQIEGMTEPFDPDRPPSTQPQEMTAAEFEDLLTFVTGVEPVDLGAPLVVHQ